MVRFFSNVMVVAEILMSINKIETCHRRLHGTPSIEVFTVCYLLHVDVIGARGKCGN